MNAVPAVPVRPPVDWLPLLDSALGRLAERDRWPILLCDLQGRTRTEAAAELGIGEGTLSSRLARAREKLRNKLGRLGVSLSAAGLAAGLTESAAGTVPNVLIETTLAAGSSAAAARDLAEGVMRGMALLTLAKRSTVALGLLAAGVVLVPWAGAEQQPTPKDVPKAEPKAAAPNPDLERIQGKWVVEGIQGSGISTTARGQSILFDGKTLTAAWLLGGAKTFRLDTAGPVKHIDLELNEVPDGLKRVKWVVEAVYAFVGDELHLAFGDLDRGGRPTSLRWKDGDLRTLLVLRRATPTDQERERLKGEWVGQRAADAESNSLRDTRLSVGETFLHLRGGNFQRGSTALQATYTLDASATPKRIDLTLTEDWVDAKKGVRLSGIYEVDGEGLALAFGLESRPATFRASETNPHTFVFRRQQSRSGFSGGGRMPPAPKAAENPAEKPPVAVQGCPTQPASRFDSCRSSSRRHCGSNWRVSSSE